jgi:hypothetical protein
MSSPRSSTSNERLVDTTGRLGGRPRRVGAPFRHAKEGPRRRRRAPRRRLGRARVRARARRKRGVRRDAAGDVPRPQRRRHPRAGGRRAARRPDGAGTALARGPADRPLRAAHRRARRRRGVARAAGAARPPRPALHLRLPSAGSAERAGAGGRGAVAERTEAAGRHRHRRPDRQRTAQRTGRGARDPARRPGRSQQRRPRLPGCPGRFGPGPLLLPARRGPAAAPGTARAG